MVSGNHLRSSTILPSAESRTALFSTPAGSDEYASYVSTNRRVRVSARATRRRSGSWRDNALFFAGDADAPEPRSHRHSEGWGDRWAGDSCPLRRQMVQAARPVEPYSNARPDFAPWSAKNNTDTSSPATFGRPIET